MALQVLLAYLLCFRHESWEKFSGARLSGQLSLGARHDIVEHYFRQMLADILYQMPFFAPRISVLLISFHPIQLILLIKHMVKIIKLIDTMENAFQSCGGVTVPNVLFCILANLWAAWQTILGKLSK